MKLAGVAACIVGLAACRGATVDPVGPARFVNAPPVWRVNDRLAVKQPKELPFYRALYHFDSFYLRVVHGLELRQDQRALGVNSFDEVPDSTWFTNRITARTISPAEIRRGPGAGDPPDLHLPWTILHVKEGGTTPGFRVTDARGVTFLLKLDAIAYPEVETGADAVASRLIWAAGYNVPEDHIVYFTRKDLRIAKDAYRSIGGKKQALDAAALDAELAAIERAGRGRIRGLASVLVSGEPLGGTPRLGVRDDDPNDRIPHELRRDQRGAAALFQWISHTDIKEDNTLDVFQRDPRNPKVAYVVHYLIDFDNSLGAQALVRHRAYIGYQYVADLSEMLRSFFTLGSYRQPWEGRDFPDQHGIGVYSAKKFNPGRWKANTFAQLPVLRADRVDNFWGAKIAMRFTRAQIAAAVDAGHFSSSAAARYLIDTIVARQRIVGAYWFARTNPIDEFTVEGDRLCFTDLALHYHLLTTPTTFTVRAYNGEGRAIAYHAAVPASASGRACAPGLQVASGGSRYTIFHIDSSRGMPGTLVHVADDPVTHRARVIGIYRS